MTQKKKPTSKKVVRRVVRRKVQKNPGSYGTLIACAILVLLAGIFTFIMHSTLHSVPIARDLHISPTIIPSPTLYPPVDHTQTYVPKSSYELTAYEGMTRYLDSYRYPKEKESMSLDSFTIDSISACSFITDSIQCNLAFSIHPHDTSSRDIGIENGILSADGWILHKHGVLLLRLSADNLYEVWSIADGMLGVPSH